MKNKRRSNTSSSSCSDDDVPLTIVKMNGHSEDPYSDGSCVHSDDDTPLTIVKMNGHSKDNYSDSSCQHSDDDIPLKLVKMNGHIENLNSYNSLCQYSVEACEFCDKISENRYTSLIHNMRHIIIPLLNQTVYQCHICLHHFTSQEDLRTHKLRKHFNFNTIPQVHLVKNEHIELFQTLTKMNNVTAKNSEDLLKKSSAQITEDAVPIQIIEDDIHEHRSNSKLNTSKRKFSVQFNEQEICYVPQSNLKKMAKRENIIEIIDLDEYDMHQVDSKLNTTDELIHKQKVESIKNRLIFEDDVPNSDRLLNDLTTDCKVNLEMLKPAWLDEEFVGKSVHFDELVKPGVYRCRICGKGFPIRYHAIVHESSHISFKNSQITLCRMCNQYILGNKNNLRLHYLSNHKENPSGNHRQIQTTNYKMDIKIPKLVFEDDRTDDFEDKRVLTSKTLMLCELCYSFCKNRPPTINYVLVRTVSELGKRYCCERCGSKFFEINLVRRDLLRKIYSFKKKKHMSNEDRLKIIQHRFKMMKN